MSKYVHIPFSDIRRNNAQNIRNDATNKSVNTQYSGDYGHVRNNSEVKYEHTLIDSFTKGLGHYRSSGVIMSTGDFAAFRRGIDEGDEETISEIKLSIPRPRGKESRFQSAMARGAPIRGWESMAAGLTYSLEGADCQRLTMPPAPTLDSIELAFEMTELYWMALLRDMHFIDFDNKGTRHPDILDALASLNRQPWAKENKSTAVLHAYEERSPPTFYIQNLFRGRTKGDNVGPYLSQFLLIGTPALGTQKDSYLADTDLTGIRQGFINYGSVRIDQRVRVAKDRLDYMTTWESWLDVQNAADVRGREKYENESDEVSPKYRFITTPRDLATYVHYDALYEAYLNACIIMLELGVKFDPGLPFTDRDWKDKQSGFATFGGPHILTLVTEVATRALKVARFQKFNVHRRPRPEAIAALIDGNQRQNSKKVFDPAEDIANTVDKDVLERIFEWNKHLNTTVKDRKTNRSNDFDPVNGTSENGTYLLPMAFAEGSPMHPSYGAGHATVAAACVTVLKAFFDHTQTLPFAFVPSRNGRSLQSVPVTNR